MRRAILWLGENQLTEELRALIIEVTCGTCHGNGHFGGRSLKKIGNLHHYQDESYVCKECKGSGIDPCAEGIKS